MAEIESTITSWLLSPIGLIATAVVMIIIIILVLSSMMKGYPSKE